MASTNINGTSGADLITGTSSADKISAGAGDDTVNAGAGNDTINGGGGADTLDGGSGSDIIHGDGGNDIGIWRYAENIGAVDYYDGDGGFDTLRLSFTTAEWTQASVQADMARFLNFMATEAGPQSDGHLFSFSAFGLSLRNWEKAEIYVDGKLIDPYAPFAQNDGNNATEAGVHPGNTSFPGTPTATGNVLANDLDVDSSSLSVYAVNGATGNVAHDVTGTYGKLHLNADGSYTYSLDNSDTDTNALAQGQTATDVFTYTVTDPEGHTGTATLTITVTGTNDAPVAVADNNGTDLVTETGVNPGNTPFAGDPSAAGNVLANDTDPDASDSKAVAAVNGAASNVGAIVTGTYGTLTLGATGGYTYSLDNADSDTNALSQGQTAADVFTYTMTDSQGATATAQLTIHITGTNDAPVAVADNNGTDLVTETGVNPGNTPFAGDPSAAGNVLANDTDPDASDSKAVAAVNGAASNVGAIVTGTYGTLTLGATGGYTYSLDNADSDTNALSQGQTAADVFTYTMTDSQGATATAQLTIHITGTNDAPVAVADNNGTDLVTETGVNPGNTPFAGDPSAAGNVLANDTDPDASDSKAVAAVNGAASNVGAIVTGTYGTLTLGATGGYTYSLDNADSDTNALSQGQTAADVFTYTMTDSQGATGTAQLTIHITGTNDAPVAVADNNGTDLVTETGVNPGNTPFAGDPSAAGNVLANDTDPDASDSKAVAAVNGAASNVGAIVTGTYGTLTLGATGGYTYSLDNADSDTNALSQGQTAADVFTYTMTDSQGATGTAQLTIHITGTNDAPLAASDANSVTEGTTTATTVLTSDATHNVLFNDTDVDSTALSVYAVNGATGNVAHDLTGSYGTLHLNANGSYTYTLDNTNTTVNALNSGGHLTDSFTYTATDDQGATATATLAITINGVTDNTAPVAHNDIWNVTENTLASFPKAATIGNDTDADGDTLTVMAVNGATGNVGMAVGGGTHLGTLTLNADGSATYNAGTIATGTATDSFTYTVSDGHGGTSSATINITLYGVNGGSTPTTIDLSGEVSGAFSYIDTGNGNDSLSGGSGTDTFLGGPGNDTIVGGNNSDTINGENGNDSITGGGGSDALTGGGANDTFVYLATSDSTPTSFDTITDFLRTPAAQADKIDLSAIDANTSIPLDQAFAFQGAVTASSLLAANSVAFFQDAAHTETIVFANVDGVVGHVNMEIHLAGILTPTATDFVL